MKKSRILALGLALLLSVTAAGCSNGSAASSDPEPGSSPGNSTAANGHVALLRVGTTKANDTFNSTTQGGAFGHMNYNSFCAGLLFERDENGDVRPGFLKNYSIGEDDRTLTLVIPTGALWHDGQPVTIEDLKFTFAYSRDKLNSAAGVESLEVQGDDTLVVTFEEGRSAFAFVNEQTTWGKIYPKHIWETVENPAEYNGEDATIGCGPYKLTSIDKDAQISYFEAMPDYWKGELTVDKVSVKTYASDEALLMALKNDEIDAIFNYSAPISPTLFPTVEQDRSIDLGISQDPGNYMIMFGYNAKPTSDYAFREAVSYALNYEMFDSTIYGGYSDVPSKGVIPPPNMGFDDTIESLSHDLEKAMELLDKAGYTDRDGDGWREYPDGSVMDVLITPQYNQSKKQLYVRIAAVIQDSLKKVGVKTTLDEASLGSREAWSARSENGGTYQLYIGTCTSGIASYIGAPTYIVTSEVTGWWGTCNDPEYLDAFERVHHVSNFEDYKACMKELQRLNAKNLPAVSLAWGTSSFPYRTDKYEGWINFPGWGVINNKTWYTLRAQ